MTCFDRPQCPYSQICPTVLEKPEIKARIDKLKTWAGPVFVLVMLIAALWLLHRELKEYSLQEFKEGLLAIPFWKLSLAIFLTVLNYAILVCYDWLGIWYIKHPMKFGRVALASFLGYSVGNNFGLLFGGSTIRYRLYSTWGLSASEIVTLLFILAISFWVGLFALSGIVFLIDPLDIPAAVNLPMKTTRPLGWILTGLAVCYLVVSAIGKPITIWKKQFHPPPLGLSIAQYVVTTIDLLVAAGIVYVLLPESIEISYFKFVGVFLLAQVAVFVTQVPGGLGVLELCLITLLAPSPDAQPQLFAALMAYRLIFYLTPMVIGIVMLGAHEVVMQKDHLSKAFGSMGVWTPDIAPRISAVVVFFAGVCMLIAAALPVEDARIELLNQWLPVWLIEINYFLCGVLGVLLLVLSRVLYQRIDMAWIFTLPTLIISMVCALTGSLGYWQVAILLTAFLVLAPIRHYFHRRGKILTDQIAYHWLVAIIVVLLISVWLFWFAFKHRNDLSWRFWEIGLHADAPRALRAIIGATLTTIAFYATRFFQITIGRPESTTHRDIQMAANVIDSSIYPAGNLFLQGDKRLFFDEAQSAVIAYEEHGKSCVALGNPIGQIDQAIQLAWDFQDMCRQQSRWPIFYLVDERLATLYQEMNLRLFHIGDQALVDLEQFDSIVAEQTTLHAAWKQNSDAEFSVQIVAPQDVPAILPDLERINEAWKNDRSGSQLKFSISHFNSETIKRNHVAVVTLQDRTVGFATLWTTSPTDEFSVGMVRYLPETPATIMDYLLVEIMQWGRQSQFRFMDLGEAPIANWHSDQHIRMRSQLMSLAFRFARHFFSYQGLRNYKDRFQPLWRPVYVACPPDKPLETVLSDVAHLIGSSETAPRKRMLKAN